MTGGAARRGYTVVEVMIFLAVSGALMVAAMIMLSGQQAKTEFSQAAREFESRIRDIINDVSVGYYPNDGNVKCTADPAGVRLETVSSEQGTNAECIFVGRVIQFAPQGSNFRVIRIYTIAGLRQTSIGPGSKREVKSLQESNPRAIARGTSDPGTVPEVYEDFSLGPIRIDKVTYTTTASPPPPTGTHETGGVGFFTTFRGNATGGLESGSTSVALGPIPDIGGPATLNQNPLNFVNNLNNTLKNPNFKNVLNPSGGVSICLLSTGTNQRAMLTIGGQARTLTTDMYIEDGTTCP